MSITLLGASSPRSDVRALAPDDLFRRRLTTYTFLRIILASGLFGIATYLVLHDPSTLISRTILFVLAAVTYLFLGVSAGLVARVRRRSAFVIVQLLFDAALITALVQATGGMGSLFFVLYFMNIVAGAYLGYGQAAQATAGIDAVAFLGTTALTALGVIPGDDLPTGASFFVDAALRVAGFLLVGLLTGRLSASVRSADHALLAQREHARALEQEFGLIIHSVPSGILIVDPQGIVRGANPAAVKRVGFCEGWPLARVIPGFDDRSDSQEVSVQGPEGAFTLLAHASTLGDEGGRVVVFEDVSRLREMEAEIDREERLVGVGRIAAAIAHEIRNPLASLSGSIQLLKEENAGPLVEIAIREIARINELVGDFLDTARPIRLRRCTIDAHTVAQDVATAVQQDARYRGFIHVLVEGSSGTMAYVDPNCFRQILWNLVLNGAQAMPAGGDVIVRCSSLPGSVSVEVIDHGTGIAPDALPKVFDPFYTTRQGGTGLGLATVHRLVRAHAGNIDVRSKLGRGSTFRLVFPDRKPGSPPDVSDALAAGLGPQGESTVDEDTSEYSPSEASLP
jgi:two-component system, NtrC family, sensor histidine kinase PilS